jgi:hypothetical protein
MTAPDLYRRWRWHGTITWAEMVNLQERYGREGPSRWGRPHGAGSRWGAVVGFAVAVGTAYLLAPGLLELAAGLAILLGTALFLALALVVGAARRHPLAEGLLIGFGLGFLIGRRGRGRQRW